MVVVVALGVLTVLGAVALATSGPGWQAEYARVSDEVAAGLRLSERSASGNAACFDVCRQLVSQYRSQVPAEQAVPAFEKRLREAGFIDVGWDCERNPWCSAWGSRGDIAVTVSQYKPDSWAAEDPQTLQQLTVTVGTVD